TVMRAGSVFGCKFNNGVRRLGIVSSESRFGPVTPKFTRFTILAALRSGAPWRDLPETYGPRTTCYNRFVRWRQAGIWDRIMDALAAGHDAAADDRYLRRVGAPARCLHHGQ